MFKKSLMRLALGLCLMPTVSFAAAFADVSDKSSYAPAIDYLKQNGIVSGYPDGTFKPDQAINRAEALKITILANRYLARELTATAADISYPDVKNSDWYFNFVKEATVAGIVEGYPDGRFQPAEQINAVESLKIALKTLDNDFAETTVATDPYLDVPAAQWFANFVQYAKTKKLITADAAYKFYPARKMTRGSFADLIYRLTFVEKNNLTEFPLSQNWQYCNNQTAGYKIKLPSNWKAFKADDSLVFWFKDEINGQVSFARAYPNSGVIILALDEKAKQFDFGSYINSLDYGTAAQKQSLTLNDLPYAVITELSSGFQDHYFKLSSGNVLIAYTQTGSGPISAQLKEEIRYAIGSVREADGQGEQCGGESLTSTGTAVTEFEKIRSMINQLVLMKGQSKTALDLVSDEVILSTDSLGIGTGPIDYYYSTNLNLSLKIDRNSATILAVKNEKTSNF